MKTMFTVLFLMATVFGQFVADDSTLFLANFDSTGVFGVGPYGTYIYNNTNDSFYMTGVGATSAAIARSRVVSGKFNKCFDFSQYTTNHPNLYFYTDYLSNVYRNPDRFIVDKLTIEAWIKVSATTPAEYRIFSKDLSYDFWVRGRQLVFTVPENFDLASDTLPVITPDEWHYVAVTWHTYDSLKFFWDGQLVSKRTLGAPYNYGLRQTPKMAIGIGFLFSNCTYDRIGGLTNCTRSYFFKGQMDDFRVTNGIRSEHEIDSVWTQANIPNNTSLVTAQPIYQVSSYPEPFNSSVSLRFTTTNPEQVLLRVFDAQGRLLSTPFSGISVGNKSVAWDGTRFPSGRYIYQLQAGPVTKSNIITLVR